MKKELLPLIKDKLKVKKHRLASLLEKRDEIAFKQKQYRVDNKIEFFDGTDRFYKGTERDGDTFGPNPPQAKILQAWENPMFKTFTICGGNRLGKCLTYQTLIDTPDGEVSIGELFERGEPFKVYAWDSKKVIADALIPFKKAGLHECYRIEMSDGSIVEAADYHRILTSHGWIYVDSLHASFTPIYTGGNSIISIKPIGKQEVYDFTVPKYHNYCAGGLVHHNTAILTIIAICYMAGYWLWNGKRIPIKHQMPRKIRYIGQDWEKHIKGVVVPCFEEWWPKRRKLTTKNNQVGVKALWKDVETGSTLEIMSSQQDSSQHEGWDGDLIPFDEPPPRDIYIANARGLVDREGREIFGATLLKEAWVDRDVIKKRDKDGKPDMSVFNVHGDAYENVGYGVTLEGVEQFKNKLNEDEIQARIYGKPSYMSGLVYPTFNRQTHLKKRFKVPLNWIVDVAIDVHPRKKQAISFIATSPKQEKYLIHEIWEHGDGQWIGDEVVRMMNRHSYRAGRFLIDPLAKGDGNNENTVFDKVSDALFRHGFILETGSKDKSSGIIAVKTYLMGANNEPSLYIFDDLSRVVYEIEGYMYDDKGEPKKIDDDMLENLRRLLLLDTMYTEMEDEEEFAEAGIGRDNTGGY